MTTSPGTRLRLAVAGGGLIAQAVHLPTLEDLGDRFELVGLADPDPRVRARIADRHRVEHTTADHRELLALEPDALLVCAPNALHAGLVLDGLDAGCHVLVEKPLCLTDEDAERIVRRRDETGLVVQVGYMKRFDAAYEALRQDLAAADPRVRHLSTLAVDPGLAGQFAPPGFARPRPAPADVRSDAFLGALVHDVNAVRGLLGEADPGSLRVLDAFADPAGDLVGGSVALPDGARWTMAWALEPAAGRFEQSITILADDGMRSLTFPAPYLRQASAVLRIERASGIRGSTERVTRSHADAYRCQWEHFFACAMGVESCRTPPEQARADLALLTRLHEATLEAELAA